jgi:hypothetical protein
MGKEVSSQGYSGQGMKSASHLYLFPRSRMIGSIPLLHLYAFNAWEGKLSLYLSLVGQFSLNFVSNKLKEFNFDNIFYSGTTFVG